MKGKASVDSHAKVGGKGGHARSASSAEFTFSPLRRALLVMLLGLSAGEATALPSGNQTVAGAVTITTGVGSETLTYAGATANDAHVATAAKYINAITLGDGAVGPALGLASDYQLRRWTTSMRR